MGEHAVGDEVWIQTLGYTGKGIVAAPERKGALAVRILGLGTRKVKASKVRAVAKPTVNRLERTPDYTLPTKQGHMRAPSPHRDASYLAWLRTLPCCYCGQTEGVQASHHGLDGGSTGLKPSDYNAVPLCNDCHIGEYHRTGVLPGLDRAGTDAFVATRVRWLNQRWLAGGAS